MVDRPRAIHLDLLPLASPLQVESLSTLSHELRTPLTVMLGFAEMLEDPECDEAQRGQLLHRIKAAAAGLVELVDRALAAAEAEVACPVPRPIASHDPSQEHDEAPNDASLVLVIEDDADSREATLAVLEACGYPAVGAANGCDGLQILRTGRRPGLIVLDLMMPVMDGWQFRTAQVQETDLASIPTLVCTARGDAEGRALAMGAVACIQKPINFDRLLKIVEGHCAKP